MYASFDQIGCIEQLINQREQFVCRNCHSITFIVEDAFWATKGTPRTPLWVEGSCAECDMDSPYIVLSVEDAKRCGFSDPDEGL